jgi:Mrp family chromosome partitioning ATPase
MRPLDENFRILRVRVQHAAGLPALVVVSAAMDADRGTLVACGLARAFAEAGIDTLLLDARSSRSEIAQELELGVPPSPQMPRKIGNNLTIAALFEREERLLTDSKMGEIFEEVRGRYAVTVVDAPAIPGSGAALQLARLADGLLLAVRLGRRQSAEDLETVQLLAGTTITGIVPTRAASAESGRHTVAAFPFRLPQAISRMVARAQAVVSR